jgi:hypothetical protein
MMPFELPHLQTHVRKKNMLKSILTYSWFWLFVRTFGNYQ